MKFIRELLSDQGISSQRFTLLVASLLSNAVIFAVWAIISLIQGKMLDIPEGLLWLYGLANGIVMTGKILQKRIEANGEK